jgi:hypothetical protein
MLDAIRKMVSSDDKTVVLEEGAKGGDWRVARLRAEVTSPGSNIKRVSAEHLKLACVNASARVVDATVNLGRAEEAVDRARKELEVAEVTRLKMQHAYLRDGIEAGAFEGIRDFNELIRATIEGTDNAE